MSELSVKVAAEHEPLPVYGSYEMGNCACGWLNEARDAQEGFLGHVAAMTEAAVRETIAAERLTWLAGAVREAVSNAPGRSSEVNLATAYWDGYRAAGHEIADLIEEPAFAARIARGES